VPGATGRPARAGSLASQTGWRRPAKGRMRLPVHCALSAMISRTSSGFKGARGRKGLSQAVAQSAKSAIRGNRWRRTCGSMRLPRSGQVSRWPSMMRSAKPVTSRRHGIGGR